MAILRLEDVRREIGAEVILDAISAPVARDERIGLVGGNGAGKTTLLRICAGRDEPDTGRVFRSRGLRVGLLAQEANLDAGFVTAASVRDAVRAGASELVGMEHRLAELEAAGTSGVESPEYSRLRDDFEARGGYSLDVRVDAALSGLGFVEADWNRPPNEMSGGQQTRAALAQLLVSELDLLLLDEPTNHLDVAAIEWLEKTLAARAGALIVAAHDRAFLDAVVERIWELRDRRLEIFRGNYSAYLGQREERDARARKDADTRAGAIGREHELVGRYRSHRKFSKMHEHERRLAALEEQVVATPPRTGARARRLALDGSGSDRPVRSGDVAVDMEDLVCGFAGVPIVKVGRLEARRADRIGVVGPNGAGKTTLLRTIAGDLSPISGYLRIGAGVHVGYLAQIRRQAPLGATVLDSFIAATGLDAAPARSYLARFLFSGDDVFKPVDKLSGGERSRLELAIVGVVGANLLLLDEPTNHLDIPAREALEAFLRDSAATVVVVSHDRRLLESVCTQLWVVDQPADGGIAQVARFAGGYREWRTAVSGGWTVGSALARTSGATGQSPDVLPTKAPTTSQPVARPRARQPRLVLSKDAYRRRRQVVEEDLTRLGLRKSQLELALSDPSVQQNFVELRRVSSELADVDAALAQAEDAWLVLAEQAPR
ncbi:MAG: ABC-F family ATP-binding cassette domain-containing protein [Chloroflexota bacterium]